MCDSPEGKYSGSPNILPGVRCNLENKYMDARESIKSENLCVFARVRPLLPHEEAMGYKECVAAIDEQTVRVVVPTTSAKYKSSRQTEEIIEDYTFTAAFGPETGQFVFFQETMLNIMSNFVEGSNSMIFSYGITGSGKTYTLQGNSENPGIIPLSLKLFFAVTEKQLIKNILVKPHMYSDVILLSEAEKQKEMYVRDTLLLSYDEECETAPGSFRNNNDKSFAMTLCNLFSDEFEAEQRQTTLCAEDMASAQAATLMKDVIKASIANQPGVCSIWISFIEIYNETIYDLLQPILNHRPKLNLGEDKNGNVYVKGATEVCVFNSEEALKILNIGRKHLSIASTKLNYQSSRSHCIYTIRVVRLPDVNNLNHAKVNRLSFCDLAGSERASKTQTTGVRLKEANAINTSLLVLGRCLEHLRLSQMSRDKRLIPFRESKLTRIFSGFLLGQGKAAMIANASPSDYTFDETLHVLKFSAVAKKILVNDTFLSNASTTIQSICNQWGMYKANISNESMESLESDSELIQEKDELIEKLLSLAQNFAKKEKEMNEMEMHIRREVCQEYAEIREELLEMQKIRYEQEMATIKEIYENRLAKLEERYQNIIKGFKDQLSETDESFLNDRSFDASKSFEIFNDSARSFSISETERQQKEIENLQRKSVELQKSKETCQMKFEKENQVLKDTVESLQKEIYQLRDENTMLQENVKAHKELLRELREQFEADSKNYAAEKEQIKSSLDAELQKERNKYTDKVSLLEKEITVLKTEKSSYEKEIKILQEKLSESHVENGKSEKIIHDQCETISSLEHETEILRKEIENLEKVLAELKESKETFKMEFEKEKERHEKELIEAKSAISDFSNIKFQLQSDLEEKNEAIATLQQDLDTANKNCDYFQRELKVKETVSKELEKEKERLEKEIIEAKSAISDFSNIKFQLQSDLEKKNEAIATLQQDLDTANKNCDSFQRELKVKERLSKEFKNGTETLQKEMENLEKKIIELKKSKEFSEMELEKEKEKHRKEVLEAKSAVTELSNFKLQHQTDLEGKNEKISSLEQDLVVVNKNLDNLQEELKIRETVSKELEKEIDALKQANDKMLNEIKDAVALKLSAEKKASLLMEELKSCQENSQQLSSRLKELQNGIQKVEIEEEKYCMLENNCQKLRESNEALILEKTNLEKDLHLTKLNMENLHKNNLAKMAEKEQEYETYVKTYKVEIENLKNEQQNLKSNNLELKSEIDSYKEKVQHFELKITSAKQTLSNAKEAVQKLSEVQKEIDDYKQEIEKLKKTSEITSKEKNDLTVTVKELKEGLQSAENEKNELLKTLNEVNSNLKFAEDEKKELMNSLKEVNKNLQFVEKEKSDVLISVKEMKENAQFAEKKKNDLLGTINNLNERLQLSEKENNNLLENIKEFKENLKLAINEKNNLLVTVKDLKNNIQLAEKEKNDLLETIKELKESLQFAEKEKSDLLATVKQLKESIQIAEKEKSNLQMTISEKAKKIADIEAELCSDKDQLKLVRKELSEKSSQLEVLKNEGCLSNVKIKEKIAHLEDNIASLKIKETEFNALKKEHEKLKCNLEKTDKEKVRLQNILDSEIQGNLSQLKKELKEKQSELESVTKKLRENELDFGALKDNYKKLNFKMIELESENDNLKQEIADNKKLSEEKLKELKSSFEGKLLFEKEQHTIEIEETIKLKREVERENDTLRESIKLLEEKFKSSDQGKPLEKNKKETLSKVSAKSLTKTASKTNLSKGEKSKEPAAKPRMTKVSSKSEVKETAKSLKTANKIEAKETKDPKTANKIETKETKEPKTANKIEAKETKEPKISSRSLRNKEIKLQEVSFSSLDSCEPETPEISRKGRKRVSDEDFDPTKEHVSKKMKTSEESSKIPVKRQSKRKLLNNDQAENLSPVQKFANSISTRFKAVAENVSSKIASPRLTRGRKKLYNPDSVTSSKSEKVTRTKK